MTFAVEDNLITANADRRVGAHRTLTRTVAERATYGVGPFEVGTQAARGLLGGLTLVLVAGHRLVRLRALRRRGAGRARAHRRPLPLADHRRGGGRRRRPGPVVMVSAIDELARIAKVEQTVILHEDLGDGAHRYRVFLGTVTYEYETAPEHGGGVTDETAAGRGRDGRLTERCGGCSSSPRSCHWSASRRPSPPASPRQSEDVASFTTAVSISVPGMCRYTTRSTSSGRLHQPLWCPLGTTAVSFSVQSRLILKDGKPTETQQDETKYYAWDHSPVATPQGCSLGGDIPLDDGAEGPRRPSLPRRPVCSAAPAAPPHMRTSPRATRSGRTRSVRSRTRHATTLDEITVDVREPRRTPPSPRATSSRLKIVNQDNVGSSRSPRRTTSWHGATTTPPGVRAGGRCRDDERRAGCSSSASPWPCLPASHRRRSRRSRTSRSATSTSPSTSATSTRPWATG